MTITIFGYRITILQWEDVTPQVKAQVVNNIEQANSREYRMQVAENYLIDSVIDDVLSDPFWRELAIEAIEARK